MLGRPFLRAGRPGLLGTIARTAVVAGTATAVSGGMRRRQDARAEQAAEAQAYEQQQYSPPPPAPAGPAGATVDDVIAQLTQLSALRDKGVLTEQEFAAQKARLLG